MALGTGINTSGRTVQDCCLCRPDWLQYTLHKYIFIGPDPPTPQEEARILLTQPEGEESDWGRGGDGEEGRGNGGKICWVINYPSLYIHNFLLNKYANTAYQLPSPGVCHGDDY